MADADMVTAEDGVGVNPPRSPSPGYKRALHRMVQIFLLVRADEDEPKRRDFRRAGGDVVCDACGREYREHVDDPIDP